MRIEKEKKEMFGKKEDGSWRLRLKERKKGEEREKRG